MLSKSLLLGLLATTSTAFPAPEPVDNLAPRDLADGEMEIFSRDAILEARDLDLADAHGVNTTEMYKHARIKRSDGDDLTIWVNRRFVPDDEGSDTDLTKRQSARPGNGAKFQGGSSDSCGSHARNEEVTASSPYSGGVQAIQRWADGQNGHFTVTAELREWDNLVVGGSNSGANALYRSQRASGNNIRIGTQDIKSDAEWTAGKAAKFGSSWRAQGYGRETCQGKRLKYEIIRTKYNV